MISLYVTMDLESGIQMGKVPLNDDKSEKFEVHTVHSGSPEDDDVYLEELPPLTKREIFVLVMATGSGELVKISFYQE